MSTLKYGVAPTLEDNFVAKLSTEYNSSAEFLLFYALLNSYIFIMAFVYAPNPDIVAGKYFLTFTFLILCLLYCSVLYL